MNEILVGLKSYHIRCLRTSPQDTMTQKVNRKIYSCILRVQLQGMTYRVKDAKLTMCSITTYRSQKDPPMQTFSRLLYYSYQCGYNSINICHSIILSERDTYCAFCKILIKVDGFKYMGYFRIPTITSRTSGNTNSS